MIDKPYARVEDHPNLIRDLKTNAIINTDAKSSSTYNKIKQNKIAEKIRIDNLENELSEIKKSILEIKNLLFDLNEPRWIEFRNSFKIIWIWKNIKRTWYMYKYWLDEKYLQMLCKVISKAIWSYFYDWK